MKNSTLTDLLKMEIFDENGIQYPIKEGFPEDRISKSYRINNALAFHVPIGARNTMLFQLIITERGTICISNYIFPEKKTIICRSPAAILEVYSTLGGKIDIHLENDQIRSANAGTYNVMAAPSVFNRATFEGNILTVDFHPDPEYIAELAKTYPQLTKIINADRKGYIETLHKEEGNMPFLAAFLYVDLIRKIHEENINMQTRTELMHPIIALMVDPQGSTFTEIQLNYEKLMAVSHMVAYVKNNLELNYTVADLQKLSTKFNALRYNEILISFKAIYKKTPIAYIKELKMLAAKTYLDKGKRESTVASRLGYSYLSHLERDFKAYHGISIKEYKKATKDKDAINLHKRDH
ncbi:helix-turn-helix domain-containing protein [Arachidicoccus terrestris]|uniref:helix-turn-helix domain-containing protein n=1 Tax=Arachidicoccus terrestris TaxID=2875539 RepID=UPI001CC3857E|nr:AraC family transcriptional regulator [Arachidicoccus terrestris]UAY56898.1 AraC family transcriptional regulator [Arachidicoccus terrestris]